MAAPSTAAAAYGLGTPTEADLVVLLSKTAAADATHVVQRARAAAHLPAGSLSVDELEAVCRAIIDAGEFPSSISARSFLVRLSSFRALSARRAPATATPSDRHPGDSMPSAIPSHPLDLTAPSAALHAAVEATQHDRARLQEIHDLGLLSDEVDAILQEEVRDVARHFGLEIGLVSIVLDDTQVFAAQHGLGDWLAEQRGTPVEWSFCRFATAARTEFVVEDAETHALVQDNPLVRHEGIRCYAGMPLVSTRGHALGALCVIGTEPRAFSAEELAELRRRAARAVARIEARRPA